MSKVRVKREILIDLDDVEICLDEINHYSAPGEFVEVRNFLEMLKIELERPNE